jgi:hypothetical protein
VSTIGAEMTALRLIPLPIHSALEMFIGLVLIGAPFALGLSTAALVAGVVVGALVAGLALQGMEPTSVSAHHAADHGIAVGLAGAAILFAASDSTAAIIFGAAALAQLALNLTTRYTAR